MEVLSSVYTILSDYVKNLGKSPLVFILTFVLPVLLYLVSQKDHDSSLDPPKASPSLPILGNALHYKKNPDVFLADQANRLGGIFSINLAGLQTTILASKSAMKQLAFTPESVLSSHAAVADFGFRYTLGDRNVFAGTDVHKQIIKQNYSSKRDLEHTSQLYWKYMTSAMDREINCERGKEVVVIDFMVTVRRIILRTITYEMVGSGVVEMYNSQNDADFISDFMVFQDLVEECTAKAAVCPAWLAKVWFLKDCENKRLSLVAKLMTAIQQAAQSGREGGHLGRWLSSVRAMSHENGAKVHSLEDIADFAVGLLFAAHKNPAIAAAQAVLHVLQHDEALLAQSQGALLPDVCLESASVRAAAVAALVSSALHSGRQEEQQEEPQEQEGGGIMQALDKCSLVEKVVVETLRVTAHSIGAVRKVVEARGWRVTVNDDRDGQAGSCEPPRVFILPQGSYVGVSHIIPHRDKARWGADCAAFNPRRQDLLARAKNDLDFTTFSHGVHKCPGSRVAMLIVRVFVVVLLSHYEVRLADDGSASHHPCLSRLPATSFERATLAQRTEACRLKCKRFA